MIYILLPAYNEFPNLLKIFEQVQNNIFLKNKSCLVLVDDCSNDDTYKLKNYSNQNFIFKYIKNKRNLGLSLTLENGFNHIIKISKPDDIVVTLDSDNTHPIEFIEQMVKRISDNDVVIASRFVNGSKVEGLSFYRKILSFLARIIFTIFFPIKNVKDYTCNFRAYRLTPIKNLIDVKKDLFISKDFGIAADILIQLNFMNKNLRFFEIPFILYYNRKIGESKIKIFRTILLTLKIILNNLILKITQK